MTLYELWTASCSGDIRNLQRHYENGGMKNLRYEAFNRTHSLIAGAYRNNQRDIVDYLCKSKNTRDFSRGMNCRTYVNCKYTNSTVYN